jgi:Haem-binding domain
VPTGAEVLSGSGVSPEVQKAIVETCGDCHSNRTYWPVYSRLAPASWLIERDVNAGRMAMNLSQWNEMDAENRISALTRMVAEVRSGEMPPKRYLFLHPATRLTETERKWLVAWARDERRNLTDNQKRKSTSAAEK